MANQYSKLTRQNILRKMERKTNPVSSVTQLAREFNEKVDYTRKFDWYGREGQQVAAPSPSFRNKVRSLIGDQKYTQLSAR